MRVLLAAMAVALTTSVAAQDLDADFAEAFLRTFGEAEPDPMAFNEAGLSVLPVIAGNWTDAGPVMRTSTLDADLLALVCGQAQFVISLVDDDGFQVELSVDGQMSGHTLTYTFSTGRYFTYAVDRVGFMTAVMRDADTAGFPPDQVTAWMMSGWAGVSRVEAVGPDVIMIDSPHWPPQILVRCP
jgi:hypothetical protein